MATRLRILLPPSRGKAAGGGGQPWRPGTGVLPDLDPQRARLLDALGPSVAHAPTRPAIRRYQGVLYRELAWADLPPASRRRGATSLRIVSGLWGVCGAHDPIPDYRLEMGGRLEGIGRLSTWWKPALSAALASDLHGADVWDLLPREHAAAWDHSAARVHRRIRVRFVDASGRTVSHWNKLLKGALVRHLLAHGAIEPADLADWEHPSGHRLDEEASTLAGAAPQLVLRAPSA